MAEKKRGRKRKEEYIPPGSKDVEKPSSEEYAVAKWLRKNVPTKKTKFLNHNVEYFTAFKAVDGLMESPWAKTKKEDDVPLFPNRIKVIDFLDTMLRHKFFHRAKKVPVTEQELRARRKNEKKKDDAGTSADEKKKEESRGTDAENSVAEGKTSAEKEKEKRKRKIRLEMHMDQIFEDGIDAYVWIYDPIPVYYWFFGTLLVLGAIGICLFPLWPPSVRKGVYYLSIAAAGFLVFIIGLAILRVIVFCIIWMLTFGKHHLWLLPNLTEDVGFFASFWPLYHYEYKNGNEDDKKDAKKKKKKKAKDSDAEDDESSCKKTPPSTPEKNKRTVVEDRPAITDDVGDSEAPRTEVDSQRASESESESSQRSSTGRDFEIVDQDDIDSVS